MHPVYTLKFALGALIGRRAGPTFLQGATTSRLPSLQSNLTGLHMFRTELHTQPSLTLFLTVLM